MPSTCSEAPRLVRNEHGYFEARWREAGKARTLSMRTREVDEAETAFAHFLLRTTTTTQARCTVGEAWALRKENMGHVADQQRIENCWKQLLPVFGQRDIATLQQADFNRYTAQRMAAGREPSTARRELVELRATLNFAVATRRISADAVPKMILPPSNPARVTWLTHEQLERTMRTVVHRRASPNIPSRLELFLHLGLETGQRKRAMETLEWPQVDMTHDVIHFRREGEVQTRKRKASVPISRRLKPVLEAEYERRQSDWVLRTPGSIRTSFDNLFAELGIDATPHTLRHTFVSHLLMRGVPVFTISKLIEMSVAQIERTYGHLSLAHLRSALDDYNDVN